MTYENAQQPPALGVPVDHTVRPRAWACFAGSGNCIIWSTDEASVRSVADRHQRQVTPLYDLSSCPVAILDTRDALGICAPTEADFPALYALQGRRVALVDLGPNVKVSG